jgi:hypothetical protein
VREEGGVKQRVVYSKQVGDGKKTKMRQQLEEMVEMGEKYEETGAAATGQASKAPPTPLEDMKMFTAAERQALLDLEDKPRGKSVEGGYQYSPSKDSQMA